MADQPTVTVLGGGNGAFATAAALKAQGCRVHLFEAPEFADRTIAPVQERGSIEVIAAEGTGIPNGRAVIDRVTADPEEALTDADIVLYIVPAYAEGRFTDLCLPHFRPEQLLVMFCGSFGGALALASRFAQVGISEIPLIAETESLVYTGFKQDATTVKIGGYKAGLACSALPAQEKEVALRRLHRLFPDLQPVDNVIETGFRNLNPVVHAPVTILNAGRITAEGPRWRYYWEGVTEPIGRVVESLDRERLTVAAALGMALPSTRDMLLQWYGHLGAQGETLAQIMSKNPAFEVAWAPQTLEHRFLTEDIPFGLVPLEALASALNMAVPLISAHITLAGQLLGVDFRASGRNLRRLGLEGLGGEEIIRLAEQGKV